MSRGTEVAATCSLFNCSVCPRRRYKRAHRSTRSTKKQMLPSRYKLKLKLIPNRSRIDSSVSRIRMKAPPFVAGRPPGVHARRFVAAGALDAVFPACRLDFNSRRHLKSCLLEDRTSAFDPDKRAQPGRKMLPRLAAGLDLPRE